MKTSVVDNEVRRTLRHLFLSSRSIAPDLVRKISFSAKLIVSYFFVMVHSMRPFNQVTCECSPVTAAGFDPSPPFLARVLVALGHLGAQ
jgi:hypothetical protein